MPLLGDASTQITALRQETRIKTFRNAFQMLKRHCPIGFRVNNFLHIFCVKCTPSPCAPSYPLVLTSPIVCPHYPRGTTLITCSYTTWGAFTQVSAIFAKWFMRGYLKNSNIFFKDRNYGHSVLQTWFLFYLLLFCTKFCWNPPPDLGRKMKMWKGNDWLGNGLLELERKRFSERQVFF